MKPLDTQQTPSALSGPRKYALLKRKLLRSTPLSPDVRRNLGRSVLQLAVGSRREMRSVMTKSKLLSRMPPRNSVLLSPSVPASMSPNLCPSLSPRKSVSMSPRRSAPGPEPTQGRSRNQLSRNGATFLQRNLAWPKSNVQRSGNRNQTLHLACKMTNSSQTAKTQRQQNSNPKIK